MTGLFRKTTFEEFVARRGVRLEGQQRNVCRVLFDGRAPLPVEPGFRAPHSGSDGRVFGFEGAPPLEALGVVEMVAGVRSGKSRFLGAMRLLHLAMTAKLGDDIAPGERVVCSFTAPLERQARTPWRYAQGQALNDPEIRPYVVQSSAERFVVASPYDRKKFISFEVFAAHAGGSAMRSVWHLGAYVDEAAFYGGPESAVNDREIYGALSERIYRGGQLVIGSSPWSEEGLVYDLWRENWAKPTNAVVAQAPTDVLRTDDHVLALMGRKKREAESRGELDLWWREYGARFLSLGSVRLYDEDTLRQCGRSRMGDVLPSDVVVAGCDLAMVSDHAALVVARIRDGRFAVVDVVERSPEPGKPLRPSELCREFAEVMARRGARWVMADGHYRESLREAIQGSGIILTDAPLDPSESHVRARTLMREGRVDLLDDQRLLHQMGLVKRRPARGGRLAIDLPRGTHGHCDVAIAYALAMFQAYGAQVPVPAPLPGSPEWLAAEEAKMVAAEEAELEGQSGRFG